MGSRRTWGISDCYTYRSYDWLRNSFSWMGKDNFSMFRRRECCRLPTFCPHPSCRAEHRVGSGTVEKTTKRAVDRATDRKYLYKHRQPALEYQPSLHGPCSLDKALIGNQGPPLPCPTTDIMASRSSILPRGTLEADETADLGIGSLATKFNKRIRVPRLVGDGSSSSPSPLSRRDGIPS